MKRLKLTALLFAFTVISAFADMPKINDIMNKIDDITQLKTDGTAKVKITQQKVNQGLKVLESIYYRRDRDDAFLIVMTAPEVEKGNGYLRVGDNFWMYRRNTRKNYLQPQIQNRKNRTRKKR